MKGPALLIFCALVASSLCSSCPWASNVGERSLHKDVVPCGKNWIKGITGFESVTATFNLIKTIKDKGDLAEIKKSLREVSSQLNEIKSILNDIIKLIEQMQIQLAFQEDERVISDSLLYYNRMMNMTTKIAHHQARQFFIVNGNQVFESVIHLLRGLSGEIFLGDILQSIIKTKLCHRRSAKEYVDQFMGLVNSGIYVLAAFYQNTRTSDELSNYNVMLISELYDRTETRVNYEIARCPAEITISVPNGAPWGEWGKEERCPGNMRAVGFTTKVQKKQGWGDDTALNGIRLYCRETGNSQEKTITSSVGKWGSWKSPVQYCSNGEPALTAFQLRVEVKRSIQARVTAANNINFKCEGGQQLNGSGMTWGDWGDWSYSCPFGICGIQTKVQGVKAGKVDDTALNDVKFICCP